MLRLYVVLWAVGAVLWLYSLIDAITSNERDVRREEFLRRCRERAEEQRRRHRERREQQEPDDV